MVALVVMAWLGIASSQAEASSVGSLWAQQDQANQQQSQKKSGKKRKPRKRKKPPRSSGWMPPWSPPGFAFGLQPIVGFSQTVAESGGVETATTRSEAGLAASIQGIPLPGGNPGFYIGGVLGYAPGYVRQTRTEGELEVTNSSSSTRKIGGPQLTLLADWFRYRLNVTSASLEYDKPEEFEATRSLSYLNEPGIMLKPGWMAFLTAHHTRLWYDEYDDPLLTQGDYWLHTRKHLGVMSLFVDAGPGTTNITTPVSKGTASYVKLVSGLNPFWKIGIQYTVRYITAASADVDDSLASVLLPEQEVKETEALATMPEDSLEQTVSLGVPNILFGFGFAWRWHKVTYKATAVGEDSSSTEDTSYGVTFSLSF